MKPDLKNLVGVVKDNLAKLGKVGLSRGSMLKAAYEAWETTTGKSPTKDEKEAIREAIQVDLNTLGFRQDFEKVEANKPFVKIAGDGEIEVGRNTKYIDTRRLSIEEQLGYAWEAMKVHWKYCLTHELYTGTDGEVRKTRKLKNAVYSRLYQLDDGNEMKHSIMGQMTEKYPPASGMLQHAVKPVLEVATH